MRSFEAANGATKRSAYDRRLEFLNIFMKNVDPKTGLKSGAWGCKNEGVAIQSAEIFARRYIGNADSPVF